MDENKKQYSPLTYSIYNKLQEHAGAENAISAEDLATHFGINKRLLRHKINELRNSPDFDFCVLSSNDGYYLATSREEYKRANHRLYGMAFSLLRCARNNEKKANKHNQGRITDSEFADFFKSFMEEE